VQNVRIQECWSFFERVSRKLPVDDFLAPSWFVFENGFYRSSLHASVKRWQGIAVSAAILLVCLPVILLLMLLIKLDSPGAIFYRQERVGLNGKLFHLLKFRSMVQDAEESSGPVFAQEGDPRMTRVGRIIRRLRLDEIPQLINVLKGDMDMVGPRPERPFFVKQLQEAIPYYNLRHTVRPGVTGWAQVNYTYGDSVESAKQKLQYDLYYVKHLSWYLDLVIVFLTIKEVLCGGGR
jgi:exopolysaccharide biosynthesis polyprenyl glycosylphosphotransferase